MRFLPSFVGRALVLSCLLLLATGLSACGGDEGGGDLPKAVVRGDGATPPGAVPPGYQEASGAAGATPALPPVGPPPETVLVKVNGEDITQGDVDQQITEMARKMFQGMSISSEQMARMRPTLGKQAEEVLIEQKLVAQVVAQAGIAVTDEDVAARWKMIDERLPPGMTREQALARNRLTAAEVEAQIRKGLQIEKLIEANAAMEPVTDEVVRKHYDDNLAKYAIPAKAHARHILLKLESGATEEQKAAVKAQMDAIRAELTKEGGKSFAELAKEHSACPSGQRGGDLGEFPPGQMVPEFDKLAFSLKPGVVSEPFLTQFGYHILEVEDRTEAVQRPFEEVKESIKMQLEQGAKQRAFNTYVEKLRAAATITHTEAAGK